MPDTPPVPGGAAAGELITGLRAANARLRELLAGRDARRALEMHVARIADLSSYSRRSLRGEPPGPAAAAARLLTGFTPRFTGRQRQDHRTTHPQMTFGSCGPVPSALLGR